MSHPRVAVSHPRVESQNVPCLISYKTASQSRVARCERVKQTQLSNPEGPRVAWTYKKRVANQNDGCLFLHRS